MASRKQEQLSALIDGLRGARVRGEDLRPEDLPPDVRGRQAARQILDAAAGSKTISKDDLKRAISLYAGAQATKEEKVAVGSKVLDFLKKKQIKLST